mmetsp:Transcript_30962/g.35815  ORF Transcript_30962/g.35815 Transcript_30962/m.35815 type:complete len:173 (-) Transcript_30962:25-543(-)
MADYPSFRQVKRINSAEELNDCYESQESSYTAHCKPITKRKARENDFVTHFKTEICKHWEDNGYCKFADKCAFAHGAHELRQKSKVLSSYKMKKCVHFHLEGYCPYGRRCQFVHSLRSPVVSVKDMTLYQEKLVDPSFFESSGTDCICKSRPRLPIFEGLTDPATKCNHSSH